MYSFSEEAEKAFLENCKNYNEVKILGRGAQSHVWKAENKQGVTLAIKLGFGGDASNMFSREKKILEDLQTIQFNKDMNTMGIDKTFEKANKDLYKGIKYSILYDSKIVNISEYENLCAYELEKKYKGVSLAEILRLYGEKTNRKCKFEEFEEFVEYLKKSAAFAKFREAIKEKFNIDDSNAQNVLSMFRDYENCDKKFYIAIARCAEGNLDDYIKKLKEEGKSHDMKFILDELRRISRHILKAMVPIHKKFITQSDLHPGNIVYKTVNVDNKSKNKFFLIDFGADKKITDEQEAIQDDLKSFGCGVLIPTFFELAASKKIFNFSESNYKHLDEIKKEIDVAGADSSLFISFLENLRDNKYKSANEALGDNFVKSTKH